MRPRQPLQIHRALGEALCLLQHIEDAAEFTLPMQRAEQIEAQIDPALDHAGSFGAVREGTRSGLSSAR
jgi:hypothetical protein